MARTCGQPILSSLSLQNGPSQLSTRLMSSLSARCNSHLKNFIRINSGSKCGSALLQVAASRPPLIINKIRHLHLAPCSAVVGGVSFEHDQEPPFTKLATESSASNVGEVHRKLEDVSLKQQLESFAKLARVDMNGSFLTGPWLQPLSPAFWGIALAAEKGSGPNLSLLVVFATATLIFYCAACTINDLFDMDFDAQVGRTKLRPLVTGAITPLQGWAFFGGLMLTYVAIMLQLENFSNIQVLVAIYILTNCIYPLLKRWTYWPQAWLSMSQNWSLFLGWGAVGRKGEFVSMVIPLYVAACCWTLVCETLYTYQDKKFDIQAGIKSTAFAFGKNPKLWFTGLSTMFIAGLSFGGYNGALGWPYFVSVAAVVGHLAWQVVSVDLENPADCKAKFISNNWIGAMVFGGFIFGKLLA